MNPDFIDAFGGCRSIAPPVSQRFRKLPTETGAREQAGAVLLEAAPPPPTGA